MVPDTTNPEGERTATAPPFRPPVPRPNTSPDLIGLPTAGQRLDDFELLHELGSGSFARVFLARQISLDRQVALKISLNRGQEGKTLASLEYDHIVRVFSETVHGDLRLLCMQYVPGTTLERIIDHLKVLPPQERTGKALLQAVDTLRQTPASLDLAGLRVRDLLQKADALEMVCWLGARLAEALAHAHGLGVLHRDVKPANILINPYGRPLLADFNVASVTHQGTDSTSVGGTLAYMAPEHLDAFNPNDPTPVEAVDARADIYSLGVVLYELLTGKLPFGSVSRRLEGPLSDLLHELARQRRQEVPSLPEEVGAPPALRQVLSRCLAGRPEDRYQSAAELAEALEGCREARHVEKDLPAPGLVAGFAIRHPFGMAALLTFVPHLLGSVVNVSYNALRIVERLTPKQQALFPQLVFLYNILLYPLCLWLIYRQAAPVFRAWRQLHDGLNIGPAEVEAARRRSLRLPTWAIGLACLGWLPGGLLFPLNDRAQLCDS